MAKKKWYLKGRTGQMLAELREGVPVTVTQVNSQACLAAEGWTLLSLAVRGNSRDRRKTVRELQRYLDGGRP